MTHPAFIVGRTYKTRDGHEALIYRTDAPGPYPIHGTISEGLPTSWTRDGHFNEHMPGSPDDLLPVASERIHRKVWATIQSDGGVTVHTVEKAARLYAAQQGGRGVVVPCLLIEIVRKREISRLWRQLSLRFAGL